MEELKKHGAVCTEDENTVLDEMADLSENKAEAAIPQYDKKAPFISFLFPWKGDGVSGVLLKVFMWLSVIAMGVAIYSYSTRPEPEPEPVADPTVKLGSIAIGEYRVPEEQPAAKAEVLDEYKELHEQNPDIIGWLKIEGTNINDPVVQIQGFTGEETNSEIHDHNSYYLDKDHFGNYNRNGCIVADYRAAVTDDGTRAANTLLYGHNMSNGLRFHDLAYYDPNFYGEYGEQFYKDHPVIQFDTIYEKGEYKVFAAMQQNVYRADGDPVFYYAITYKFDNSQEFYDYYAKVLDRSMFYNPDVDIQYGDEIIALSTCDFTTFAHVKDIRFVVYARRVREGESSEVDTSQYYVNPDPLYYDYYYQVMGTEWGGRTWDPALIKGCKVSG